MKPVFVHHSQKDKLACLAGWVAFYVGTIVLLASPADRSAGFVIIVVSLVYMFINAIPVWIQTESTIRKQQPEKSD